MPAAARVVAVMAGLLAAARPASADPTYLENVSAGPVIGIRIGGPRGPRAVYGVEAGVGAALQRINVGHTRRLGLGFSYVELAPWLFLGASLGAGRDSGGTWWPVLGVWEGALLYGGEGNRHCDALPDHDAWHALVSLSLGYRYTGVHELYASLKGGALHGYHCLD